MTHVLHRQLGVEYPVAVRGKGLHLIDSSGREYLDAVGGAVVCSLGYGDSDVIRATREQLEALAYVHSSAFTTAPLEALADALIARAPGGRFDKAYFVSGGSEAVEAALKLVRHYFLAIDQPRRTRFIARRNSFHGNTLGALGVGGNAGRRRPYEPLLRSALLVSPAYAYREQRRDESEDTYARRLVAELRATIEANDPASFAAFIAEPIVGASLGAVTAPPGYFEGVRRLCDEYGILMILDEVMSGMGRTGALFACTQEGVVPDLLLLAKGLAAGYQPLGAVLLGAGIHDAIQQRFGHFEHGHTYSGHATACAAALAVLRKVDSPSMLAAVAARGEQLRTRLRETLADCPYVGDVRGRGLLIGIEFVRDRATRESLDPRAAFARRLRTASMAEGVICYPVSGFLDGVRGDHVLLAPAFIATPTDIEDIVDRMRRAIERASAEVDA